MNLAETHEEAAFRQEVRAFLDETIPTAWRNDPTHCLDADRALAKGGYLGVTWPTEYGGRGASPVLAAILDEERARIGVPVGYAPTRFGLNLLGPALMVHASDEQRAEFLPKIMSAEYIFCQGFSEPEAGSDLANVQALGTDRGTHLSLSGTKIWTTQAHLANWCFALIRTEPDLPRHKGLSFVVFRMDQPGIEIQPIVQLTGHADFSQVFFDDVRVEHSHVIGGRGQGWAVAMTLLGAERSYAQLSRFTHFVGQLEQIVGLVRDSSSPQAWLEEVGTIYADLTAIRNVSYKLASLATAGEDIGSLPSIVKLWWSETHQRLVELGYRVSVHVGRDEAFWYRLWLESRVETIYAGSSQIQRNIIAERMLGLPR